MQRIDFVIDAHILDVYYFTGESMYIQQGVPRERIPLAACNMTICHIVTNKGLLFNGDSNCLDVRKYNVELGRKYAYEEAYTKLADYIALREKEKQFMDLSKLNTWM